MEEEIP